MNVDSRAAAVGNLVNAAASLYERREDFVTSIAASTGLSPQGVRWGFEYLERDASIGALEHLVYSAERAAHVHVVLSANVFIAPLRALAIARAAAPRVTVRPSSRDPWLTRALIAQAADPAITITDQRDLTNTRADLIYVYGRAETIAATRTQVPGRRLLGHGPGLGVAVVGAAAGFVDAAQRLAADIVAFDQRGCLSPRFVLVEGDPSRAETFGQELHGELERWSDRVPRGSLSPEEAEGARRWIDSSIFAGKAWVGRNHTVALGKTITTSSLPPSGRHVLIVAVSSVDHVGAVLAPLTPFLTAIGTDDPARIGHVVPRHVRLSPLGSMQRPPLDGPVDRRPLRALVS